MSNPDRNSLCLCGSGKKYKKCCLLEKNAKKQESVVKFRETHRKAALDRIQLKAALLRDPSYREKLIEALTTPPPVLDKEPSIVET